MHADISIIIAHVIILHLPPHHTITTNIITTTIPNLQHLTLINYSIKLLPKIYPPNHLLLNIHVQSITIPLIQSQLHYRLR